MQNRIENKRCGNIWVERVIWNAVAATALTGMIAVLLCSLQWLDEIDPNASHEAAAIESRARLDLSAEVEDRPTRVADVNGPSG